MYGGNVATASVPHRLPLFLQTHFEPDTANMISTLYDFGMMPGGIIVGVVSDAMGGRSGCVIVVFLLILCPLLMIMALFADTLNTFTLMVMLACMGILIGGPNNIVTSAVAADLAEHPSIRGSKSALGTVVGLINGSGSFVAAMGQMAVPLITDALGWRRALVLHALLDGHLVPADDPEDQAGAGGRGGRAGAAQVVGRLRDDQHGRAEGPQWARTPPLPPSPLTTYRRPVVDMPLGRTHTHTADPRIASRRADAGRRIPLEPRRPSGRAPAAGGARASATASGASAVEMGAFVGLEAPASRIRLRYGSSRILGGQVLCGSSEPARSSSG